MDFSKLIKRVIAIITKPNDEWQVIKQEEMSVAGMFTGYAVILALIGPIAGLIGWMAFTGWGAKFFVTWSIVTYVLSLAGVFLAGFVIDALATTFGAQKNMVESMKVAVFAMTASWVAGVFHLIPALSILAGLAGFYSLYLFYLGLKFVKNPPQDKLVGYFVVILVVEIVIYFIIGAITTAIVFGSAVGLASRGLY